MTALRLNTTGTLSKLKKILAKARPGMMVSARRSATRQTSAIRGASKSVAAHVSAMPNLLRRPLHLTLVVQRTNAQVQLRTESAAGSAVRTS